MVFDSRIAHSDLAWLLGSLCQIHRIPWNPALGLQPFAPPYAISTLIEVAGRFGLSLGQSHVCRLQEGNVHYPVIAFRSDANMGMSHPSKDGSELKPILIAKGDAKRVLYFDAGSIEPKTAPIDELIDGTLDSMVLLVARVEGGAQDTDGKSSELGAENTKTTSKVGLDWFAKAMLKHRRIWRDVLVASFAIQTAGLVTPIFTQIIIDKVTVHQTLSTLSVIALGMVIFIAFSASMTWLRQYLVLHTGCRVDAVLGSQVFRHMLGLPMSYFEHRPTGTLVARLHAVETIREFISGAAVALVLDLPFMLLFLVVMFIYSWQLTLVALVTLALITLASVLVTPLLRSRLNKQFLLGARNQAFATEYISGIETVKSLQMEPHLHRRYDDYLAASLSAGFSTRQATNTYNVVVNVLEQGLTVAILCAGALLVMEGGGFTIGMLVAFQMFAGRMSQPMLRLAGLWQDFQQASIAMRRLGDVMDAPAESVAVIPTRVTDAASDGKAMGRVDIQGLNFRYSENMPWLYENLSIVLRPGRLTLLSGPSGAGKSTLAKLLLGFYPPSRGAIRIDGRDIRHFAANELRQCFGVVPQETTLFSGTVYDNLISANPLADFSAVVQACRVAEIHDTIEELPQGYQTPLGENGVGLSGGQKQRIAIARAVLKRARILVFDEATASLDAATAERFAQTVNLLRGSATILFIAHSAPRSLQVDEVLNLGSPALQTSPLS